MNLFRQIYLLKKDPNFDSQVLAQFENDETIYLVFRNQGLMDYLFWEPIEKMFNPGLLYCIYQIKTGVTWLACMTGSISI